MNTVSCPVCPAGTESHDFLTCKDRLCDQQSECYHLAKCNGCGLIYLNPRPDSDDLSEFYQDQGYDPFLSVQTAKSSLDYVYQTSRFFTLVWKKRLVARLTKPNGRVLDVGCGTGEFLAKLSDRYVVEGIEPEPKAVKWARERFGLNVIEGNSSDLKNIESNFDLITLWHSLEHMPSPVETLKVIRQKLTPSGFTLIALPNIASFDARVYGTNWIALDCPRHLWHYTRESLSKMGAEAGLKLVETGALPLDLFYNVIHSELLCLKAGSRIQLAAIPFRAAFAASISLISGVLKGNHSGMYYIFKAV